MAAIIGQFALILACVLVAVVVTVFVMRRRYAPRPTAEEPGPAAAASPFSGRMVLYAIAGVAGLVVVAAVASQLKLGRPPAPVASDQGLPPGHPEVEAAVMTGQLEARLREAPDDAEGWRMLGWSYLQTGRNAEAATAYGRAAALDPHNAEYLSAEGEASVLAAQGQVTPAAEAIFRKAVSLDPADPRARYYLAIAKDQKGDAKGAMDDWIALLKSAPPGAPWAPEVRAFVEKVAQERHLDLTGRLPPAPAAAVVAQGAPAGSPAAAQPGPTADQVAAAGQMSEAGRQAMIQGMVDKQAASLKANPRDRAGWERLMRARMVLGQPDAAAQAYRDASRAFAGSPADQAALRQTAAGLGIPGV